ncbi:hypothetical protein BGZ75_009890 [Mortierella antarctica]|nr:hypothetical protein BGZ75_009890 [Mortierella antarctica]
MGARAQNLDLEVASDLHGFGCEPTDPEEYAAYGEIALASPPAHQQRVDLKNVMTRVKDQGAFQSCVAFGVCGMLDIVPNSDKPQNESERFVWYYAKAMSGIDTASDSGVTLAAGAAVPQAIGSCWESSCPYTNPLAAPDPQANVEAAKMKVTTWHTVRRTLEAFKNFLSAGWPLVITFDIFGDAEYQKLYIFGDDTAQTGIMHMPPPLADGSIPARSNGHCVVLVGYDDTTRLLKFKNSWGPVGDGGYYYMPYDYIQWVREAWMPEVQGLSQPVPDDPNGPTFSPGRLPKFDRKDFIITEGKQPSDFHKAPQSTTN